MKSFNYTIKDELGIHARPAGMLAKTAKALDSAVTISCGNKSASASRLMAVMGLGIKCGDTITITIEGGNEEESESAIKKFLEENL